MFARSSANLSPRAPSDGQQARAKTRMQRRRAGRMKGNRTRFKPVDWPNSMIIAIVSIISLGHLLSSNQASVALAQSRAKQEIWPAVSVPKLGLIRGLRFEPRAVEVDETRGLSRAGVAAFLGIPYAAPPRGPLRFMPPGAPRLGTSRPGGQAGEQQQQQQCQLLSNRQAAHSKPFVKFGHECVQLASWLAPNSPRAAPHLAAQSEDCLNLNIFVPYEPASGRSREPIKRAPSSAESSRAALVSAPQPNDTSISLNESAQGTAEQQSDKTHCYLEQLNAKPQEERFRRSPLPVLVTFHSAQPKAGLPNEPANRAGPFASETQQQQSDNKANSMAFVELAQRTNSIVVTFNYRIGLLGYLPYGEPLEQFQHSSAHSSQSSGSGGQTRHNHAIWDQLGLLHWLRHNIAHFNGDASNVTLVSADNEAAKLIQLLAMSPVSKGLFKRLLLVHDQRREGKQEAGSQLDRLLGLAIKSRQMKRKLMNEMSLLARKLTPVDNATTLNDHNNLELDRNLFQFLKDANLSQLASFEWELSQLKLAQLISGPNLDDKLLFPYFAHLIKMATKLVAANDGVNSTSDLRKLSSGENLFWSAMSMWPSGNGLIINETSNSLLATNSANRMQLEYCLYLSRLYEGAYKLDADNKLLSSIHELDQIDPLRLVPRVSERMIQAAAKSLAANATSNQQQQQQQSRLIQKTHSAARWLSPWSWFRSSASLDGSSESDNFPSAGDSSSALLLKGNWTQSRLASAQDFYHFRHAHLLNQLLFQKARAQGGETADLHDDEDDEEDDDVLRKQQRSLMLLSQQQQQQQQQQQDPSGGASPRAKRDTLLDQLAVLTEQLIELMSSHDLLIGFIGKPVGSGAPLASEQREVATRNNHSSGLIIESLLNSSRRTGFELDSQLGFWLRRADLHFLAHTSSTSARHFIVRDNVAENSCDFISDKIQRVKEEQQADAEVDHSNSVEANSNERLTYVFLAEPKFAFTLESSDSSDWILEASDALINQISSFVHYGRLQQKAGQSGKAEKQSSDIWTPYDTMNRRINLIGGENMSSTLAQLHDQIDVHFNLIPYLKRLDAPTSPKRTAHSDVSTSSDLGRQTVVASSVASRDLSSCLQDLSAKLNHSSNFPMSHHAVALRDESACLAREVGKLRAQMRAGAGRELEPLVVHFLASLASARLEESHLLAHNFTRQLAAKQIALMNQNQRISAMTTRNLVNQSEGMYLDQLSETGGLNEQSPSGGGGGGELRAATATATATALANPDESQKAGSHASSSKSSQFANVTTAATSSIRNFFAKTYKDAVGQALGIVIGTGALIFLLNLIIVLVIALRSARHNRLAEGKRRSCAAVQDVDQDLAYLTSANPNSASNLPQAAELLQRDFHGNSQQMSYSQAANGPTKGNLIAGNKQLTSSFKQQHSADNYEAGATRKRSVKSIKFNLSGASGQQLELGSNEEQSENHSSTFDRNSNNLNKNNSAALDFSGNNLVFQTNEAPDVLCAKAFDVADEQQKLRLQHQQQFQLTSSSPSYLINEFSDEIDLDQTSPDDEEEQQLQRHYQKYFVPAGNGNVAQHLDSAGPIFLTHQHQLIELPAGSGHSRSCQLHQQHRLNRSLGSSSLTSPFASQTTPSNNTSTNSAPIYTIQQADLAGNLLPTLSSPHCGSHNELFVPNQHIFYSPASSTLSNGTPIRAPQRAAHNAMLTASAASCAFHQIESNTLASSSSSFKLTQVGAEASNLSSCQQQEGNSYLIYAPNTLERAQIPLASEQHAQLQQTNSLDAASVQLLIMPAQNVGQFQAQNQRHLQQ